MNAATEPSATFGFSSDTGRNQLRELYQKLLTSVSSKHSEVVSVGYNLTDNSVGRQPSADRLSQRILNEETLMAQSVNEAWMNLINVTTQTVNAANQVQGSLQNATQGMLDWFTKLQATQDQLSYANMVKTVDWARSDLSTYVGDINTALSSVYSTLSALDTNMGGSEASASVLADSLNSAADQVLNAIIEYNSSIAFSAQPTLDDAHNTVTQSINQLQTYMNGQISSLGTAASGKEQATRTSSNQQIADQATSAQQLLASAQTQTSQSIATVQAQQDAFANSVRTAFENAAAYVESLVQNNSDTLTGRANVGRSGLSSATTLNNQINSLLTTFTNDEKTALARVNTDMGNSQATASKTLADAVTAATSKQSQTLSGATSISQGAISAVGTNFQSNMNAMGVNTNQLMDSLATSANDAAKQSSAAQSALQVSASQGSSAIGTAADSVTSQVQSAFKNILNAVGNIPGGISATAVSASNMLSIIQASQSNMTQAADLIRQSFFKTQSGTMLNQSQAEAAVGNLLIVLENNAPKADSLIQGIGSSLQSGASTSGATVMSATAQNSQNSQAMSATAQQLSGAQSSFASQLSQIVNQMVTSGNQVNAGSLQGGISETLSSAAGVVENAQAQIDAQVQNHQNQGTNNVNALSTAQQAVAVAGISAQSQAQSSASGVNQTVTGALGSISSFLAAADNDASAAVHAQSQKISSMQTQADIMVGQVSMSQMDQVRSVAASIDALMKQVNSYLGSNGSPLYSDIQALGGSAQKLFTFMDFLAKEHDAIAADAADQGKYTWDDVLRAMLSSLRSDNATALNQLDQISASFNSSASGLAANVSSEMQGLAADFANVANSLKNQLNSMSDSASASMGSGSGQVGSTISALEAIQKSLGTLSATASQNLVNASSEQSVVDGKDMQNAFAVSAQANDAAAADAKFASETLAKVQAAATEQANQALASMQANQVPAGDVQRAGSLAMLDASMAQSKLAQQKAAIEKLNADSSSIASDYAAEIQAQEAERQGKASLVYDSVVAAKGATSAMVGKIAQQMAQNRAARASNITSTQSDESIQIALVRRGMSGLLNIFDRFVSVVSSSFDSSTSDRDSFVAALLGGLRQRLIQLDNDIYQANQALVQNLIELQNSSDAFQNDEFDRDLAAFVQDLQTWGQSELSTIQEQDTNIQNAVNSATLTAPSTLDSTVNSAVLNIAQTAQSVLQKNGVAVPTSLTDYIAKYQQASTSRSISQ
jgi:hypothetical protein